MGKERRKKEEGAKFSASPMMPHLYKEILNQNCPAGDIGRTIYIYISYSCNIISSSMPRISLEVDG